MRLVKAAAARAGLQAEVSAHWLRHAHASHSLDRGAPIHLVQATLGHASVATTGRYLHVWPSESSARFLGVQAMLSDQIRVAGIIAQNVVLALERLDGNSVATRRSTA